MKPTTFRALTDADACRDRYRHLRKHYRDRALDEPLTFEEILDSNGLNDTLWALCKVGGVEGVAITRWFATDCAARVAHLSPAARACVETTRRFLRGEATNEELVDAASAAWAWAAKSSWSASASAWSADAAEAASAYWAAWSARDAADATLSLGWAAEDAEAAWQTDRLRLYLTTPLAEITPTPIKEN